MKSGEYDDISEMMNCIQIKGTLKKYIVKISK